MNHQVLILVVFIWIDVHAQVPFLESCPDVVAMENFDAKRYLGKWYELERYFAIFEFGGKCVTADYDLNPNGTVRVLNKQISAITFRFGELPSEDDTIALKGAEKTNPNPIIGVCELKANTCTGLESEIEGYAIPVGANNEGKLSVIFPSLPIQFAAPYWVLGTDYDSYAVVWSCSTLVNLFSTRYAWILTRERYPSAETIQNAYSVLEQKRIPKIYFIRTDQKNCSKKH